MAAALSTSKSSTEVKCMYCLQRLESREEVRKLPCEHMVCGVCLGERFSTKSKEETLSRLLKCGDCGNSFQLKLDEIPVTRSETPMKCDGLKCGKKAVSYCNLCSKLQCEIHSKFHDEMLSEHGGSVIYIENYQQRVNKWKWIDNLCKTHKEDVVASCSQCLQPLCGTCIDGKYDCNTPNNTAGLPAARGHQTISLAKGAEIARRALAREANKVQEADIQLENILKFAQQNQSNIVIRSREQQRQLSTAVRQWKTQIDEFTKQMECRLERIAKQTEVDTRTFEREIETVLRTNQEVLDKTCELNNLTPAATLYNYKDQEKLLNERQTVPIPVLPDLPLLHLNLGGSLPWKIYPLKAPYYKSLKTKEGSQTKYSSYRVCHLDDGRVIEGGGLGIKGMSVKGGPLQNVHGLDSKIPGYVYIAVCASKCRQILKINCQSGKCSKLISESNVGNCKAGLTVNQTYIITPKKSRRGTVLGVFSNNNYKHLFDLNTSVCNENVCGMAILANNSLIFSQTLDNIVRNITVEEYPTIIWELTFEAPTGVHFDRMTNCILVACSYGQKIHVVSINGIHHKTLSIPECRGPIMDLSVFRDELVIAQCQNGRITYTIKYLDGTEDKQSGTNS